MLDEQHLRDLLRGCVGGSLCRQALSRASRTTCPREARGPKLLDPPEPCDDLVRIAANQVRPLSLRSAWSSARRPDAGTRSSPSVGADGSGPDLGGVGPDGARGGQGGHSDLGSIQAGKLADLVVMDRDYLTISADDIKNIQPVMTMVGGRIVYDATAPTSTQ